MNTNFKVRFAVFLALVLALVNSFSAMAYPGRDEDRLPMANDCQKNNGLAAEIDIPARRGDYNALDRAARCVALAGVKVAIPVTGYVAAMIERYEAMKNRQAELMDASLLPSRKQIDQRFMDFKRRQAESRIP